MTDDIRFAHHAIRASAGTGKTYALTSRYIGLLAAGESPANIVATTFSRKAAGEIHERVLNWLAEAARDADVRDELNAAIREEIRRDLTAADYAGLLHGFLRATHRVRIATLDALFIGIASAFAMELQLPPGWAIGESIDESAVRDHAIAAMLEASEPQRLIDLLRLLNQGDDRASVTRRIDDAVATMHQLYLDAPLKRQWDWIERPPTPDWDRFHELIEDAAAMALPKTQKNEPNKTWLAARDKLVTALQRRDWDGLLKVGFIVKIGAGETQFARAEIDADVRDLVDRALTFARGVLIGRLAGRNEATWQLLHDYDEHHLALRRRRRLLSFDEVTRTLGAAGLAGMLDRVYYRLDATMHHLLLDEFQDTSLAQWRVIQPIAAELAATDPGERRSVFIVGDTKQAIYGWRGGNAEIFRGINAELPGLGQPGELARSWRSSPVVIDLVNRVFMGLIDNHALADRRDGIAPWANDFREHATHRTKLSGYAELRIDDEPYERATRLVVDARARQPGASIGILTRSNDKVAEMIFRLRREEVFASEEGGNPLTDSPAVSVILSLLKLADHPGDSAAMFHVKHSPLGPAVGLTASTDVTAFAASVRERLLADAYGPTVFDWVRRFASACDQRNVNRLMQLVELAHEHDAKPTVRPGDFIRRVHETRVEDPSSANVRVMTIHQAKGLEFDVVILPELSSRLLGHTPSAITERTSPTADIERVSRYANETVRSWVPTLQTMHGQYEQEKLNDGLSMLYVALTRAKHAVHLIAEPTKSFGASFAGVVAAALLDDPPSEPSDQPVWSIGDAAWRAKVEPTPAAAPSHIAIRPPASAATRRRSLPRRSPSDFEGGGEARIGDRLRLTAGGARSRGTIMHRWCELVEWADDGLPDNATLLAEANAAAPNADDPIALIPRWRAMLAQPEIAAALSRDAYHVDDLTVERERRFAVRDASAVLTGAIDRMVIARDGGGTITRIDLIDFKTDVGEVAPIVARYRPQLEAYRRAAAKLFNADPALVTPRLLLLDAGRAIAL